MCVVCVVCVCVVCVCVLCVCVFVVYVCFALMIFRQIFMFISSSGPSAGHNLCKLSVAES